MRVLVGACLAVLASVCVGAVDDSIPDLGTKRTGSDWPGFLGPTRDGRSPESGLSLKWPPEGPSVRWSREVGDGYSMVSVARGRLFLFDRHGDQARLTCLNSETGRELWRSEYATDYEDMYEYSNGPRAVPLVDDERVYTLGSEGRLRCHRVVDGTLLWEVDTTEEFGVVQNFFGAGSTPVVEGELLIALIGGSPPDSPGIQSGQVRGNGSGVVAFDKKTGEVRYRVTDELASYSSPVVTTIAGRRWGLVFARGGLVGFEPRSGKLDFHYPWRAKILESVNASNPVVVGDTVFISECYGPGSSLLRLRPGGYDVVWKDPPGREKSLRTHWSTPIHDEGILYGCSGRNSGDAELRAVELATGKVRWSEPGLGRSTLIFVDGRLVVLTERGRLLAVAATPERYELISETEPLVAFPAWSPPVLSHGLLYVKGKDRLICFDLARSAAKPQPQGR